jgi:tetratricopeptide (TPR) repeat protein
MSDPLLLGRDRELQLLAGMIDSGGSDEAVLLLGDPGIGKSSLLVAAALRARRAGHGVLETAGVEAEAQIPFAALHQLLRPVEPAVELLPDVLRNALWTALGARDGRAPDQYQVGIAVRQLFERLALDEPVTVIVDDVQWLDRPTHDALAFVARQKPDGRFLLICSARCGYGGPVLTAGTRVVDVDGLDEGAARLLLLRNSPALSDARRERVMRQALGNPLALLELPKVRGEQRRLVPDALVSDLPVTDRLERAFSARIIDLPPSTRQALLIAAVDPENDREEILRATSHLTGTPAPDEILRPAVNAGVVLDDPARVRFRHPLVRSAILSIESVDRRQAAHTALATALSDNVYRRTWHKAMSIVGPDDEVADELEGNVSSSLARGAVVTAISELERSAQLTTGSAQRGHRLLLAAELAFGLGQAETVHQFVDEANRYDLTEIDGARLEWLREIFHDGVPGDAVRVHELCRTAQRASACGDVVLALNLLLGAALRCWWADTGPEARARVAAVTAEMGGAERDPRYIAARAVAEPVLEAASTVRALSHTSIATLQDADALRLLGIAAHAVGDSVRATDLFDSAEALLRDQGRLGLLLHVLGIQVNLRLELGDFAGAERALEEGRRIALQTEQEIWNTGTIVTGARCAGLRGDTERALRMAAEGRRASGRQNDHLCCAQLAFGIAYLSDERFDEAYEALRRMFDPNDPSHHWRESFAGLMPLAEAAGPAGRLEDARRILADHELISLVTPSPLLRTHLLYARAVLAEDEDAEWYFLSALAEDLSRWRLAKAKIEHAFGEWLLRHHRYAEARERLVSALRSLSDIGAVSWARQARRSLQAAGCEPGTPPGFD